MNSEVSGIQFPNGPKLELESLLTQLIGRANEVMSTQARLRNLITATNSVVADLDLSTVLRNIAESARKLVNAKYAAMGVIGADGQLEQFIHVGMDASIVDQIDHLPDGKGLLGALIQDPQPVRLTCLADDHRSSGFPANHPPMTSFLGVPIRVRDEVYGNLYLTDQADGEFSADDEELIQALAASAGVAIANARLFEESRFREQWSNTLAEINRQILANDEDAAVHILTERLLELARADLVCVLRVVPEHNSLAVDRAVGQGADQLLDATFPFEGSVAQSVVDDGNPRSFNRSQSLPNGFLQRSNMAEALLVPFNINAGEPGLLVVARLGGRQPFNDIDSELASSFADQVNLAVQRSRSRADQQEMEILEDRNRIARDLHDHVIQRLFAAGLSLQAVARGLGPGTAATKITAQISDIDETIGQIRQTIFALKAGGAPSAAGLRARLREVADRVAGQFVSPPEFRFVGPVDLMSDAGTTDDVVAVVTEALANVVRHAHADCVSIEVSTAAGNLRVEVIDDGIGFAGGQLFSGLSNLRNRAQARDGEMRLEDARPHGTHLTWSIPV